MKLLTIAAMALPLVLCATGAMAGSKNPYAASNEQATQGRGVATGTSTGRASTRSAPKPSNSNGNAAAATGSTEGSVFKRWR